MKISTYRLLFIITGLLFYLPLPAQEIALQLYSLREQMKTDAEATHLLPAQWGIKYLEGG